MQNKIKVIAFDADDTLWVNEPYFREAEEHFCSLLENYMPREIAAQELFKTEMDNLPLYGYGVKGFTLSMLETLTRVTEGKAPLGLVDHTIEIGKALLARPVELLENVEETLAGLHGRYRLVVATKGDLLDQERKLKKSGLLNYFHHIEIMSDKQPSDYNKLLRHLDCQPENFLMLGNSLKSDVLPVLNIDAWAGYIPYHITWAHEHVETMPEHERLIELTAISDILQHLQP
jgi:putative hydrolase of the HAD superfamily